MENYLIKELLKNLKIKQKEINALLEKVSSHWGYEDPIYRFYHKSQKVFNLQKTTKEIVELLKDIAPEGCTFNKLFEEIFKDGNSKTFTLANNKKWSISTRPIIEAFFHSRYFLQMAVKYGTLLKEPPEIMDSGWAALLYFYNLR